MLFTYISIYDYYISLFGVRKCFINELYNVLLHDTNFLYISIWYLVHFDEIIVLSNMPVLYSESLKIWYMHLSWDLSRPINIW